MGCSNPAGTVEVHGGGEVFRGEACLEAADRRCVGPCLLELQKPRPEHGHVLAARMEAGVADHRPHVCPAARRGKRALAEDGLCMGGELLDGVASGHGPMVVTGPDHPGGNLEIRWAQDFGRLCGRRSGRGCGRAGRARSTAVVRPGWSPPVGSSCAGGAWGRSRPGRRRPGRAPPGCRPAERGPAWLRATRPFQTCDVCDPAFRAPEPGRWRDLPIRQGSSCGGRDPQSPLPFDIAVITRSPSP